MKKKIGRPLCIEYKDEFCDLLIEHMSEGFSFESFGPKIGASRDILYKWCNEYESFLNAKRMGVDASLAWWEKLGRAGAAGQIDKFNSSTWIFIQKCRFGMRDGSEISRQKGPESETKAIEEAALNLETMLNARIPKQ